MNISSASIHMAHGFFLRVCHMPLHTRRESVVRQFWDIFSSSYMLNNDQKSRPEFLGPGHAAKNLRRQALHTCLSVLWPSHDLAYLGCISQLGYVTWQESCSLLRFRQKLHGKCGQSRVQGVLRPRFGPQLACCEGFEIRLP